MAMPIEAAMSRCGSFVSDWLMTQKTTSPTRRYWSPWPFGMILQPGGKMLLTRTRLKWAIPASLSAISNELSFSRWRPTPFVRKIFFETNIGPRVSRCRAQFITDAAQDDQGKPSRLSSLGAVRYGPAMQTTPPPAPGEPSQARLEATLVWGADLPAARGP